MDTFCREEILQSRSTVSSRWIDIFGLLKDIVTELNRMPIGLGTKIIGCSGCGLWNKGRILLNADCDRNHLAICRYEIIQSRFNACHLGPPQTSIICSQR